jgi:3-hydroxyisobutyrate dehydrogenase
MAVNVTFIGLGAMGLRMAQRLAQTPEVVLAGYDIDPSRVDAISGEVRKASSIADAVSDADLIFSALPADRQVLSSLAELLPAVRAGSTYVDFATISPATIESVESQLVTVGVATISAGMTGSVAGAASGTLSLFIGGPEQIPERFKPAFDAIAAQTLPVGTSGAAKAVKLVNNMVIGALDCAITEALALGEQYGLTLEQMTDAFRDQGANSWTLEALIIKYLIPGELGEGVFSTRLMHKDMSLYVDFAAQRGLPAIFAGLAASFYRGSAGHGYGDKFHPNVVRWFERGEDLGGRPRTSLSDGQTADAALRLLAGGVAALQALVSAEAIGVLGRMGVAPDYAASLLARGSARNDSLGGLLSHLTESGSSAYLSAETLAQGLARMIAMAAAADVPVTFHEAARHVALSYVERYGRDADDIWQPAVAAFTGTQTCPPRTVTLSGPAGPESEDPAANTRRLPG